MANSQRDHVGVVGLDGDEVVGDDGHDMVVDGEPLDGFSASVDQPQSVRLSAAKLELGDPSVGRARGTGRREFAVENHFSVDEIVVREGRRVETGSHDAFDDLEVVTMGPVALHRG